MTFINDSELFSNKSYHRFITLSEQSKQILESLDNSNLMHKYPFKAPCSVLSLLNFILIEREESGKRPYDNKVVQDAIYKTVCVVCEQLDIPVPSIIDDKNLDKMVEGILVRGLSNESEELNQSAFDAAVLGAAGACYKLAFIPTNLLTQELLDGAIQMVYNFNALILELTDKYLND